MSVLAGCATVASVAPQRAEPVGQPALDKIVRRYHDAGDFDGIVVVRRGGRVVYRAAIGEADRGGHVIHELDELFPLASLTKQVTALLVMQQVELGALGLDVAIGAYLPKIDNTSRAITVRQLLQHTSGLPNPDDGAPDGTVPAFYMRTGLDVGDHALVLHTVCGGTPRPPGTFSYNNCDYLMLGMILERVTGLRYADLVARRVVVPLGLTSWRLATARDPRPTSPVRGYQADGSPEKLQNIASYGAAGALYGSADDLARWSQALIEHRLLSAAATNEMFRSDPALHGEALGSWSYALDIPGRQAVQLVERQGWIGGIRLLSLIAPREDVAIEILANTERAPLFELWARRGLPFDLVLAVFGATGQ